MSKDNDELVVRLVYSNTHCNTKKRNRAEITKKCLYDGKLFYPPYNESCFSGYLLSLTTEQELKDFAKTKESEEYKRLFIGFATLPLSYIKSLGLNINPKEEEGMTSHVNFCFPGFTYTKGNPIPNSVGYILQAMHNECKFTHDTNKSDSEWKLGDLS